MKFKEIPFADQEANRVYREYLDRIRYAVRTLDKESQEEILLEINSHIYEGMNDHPGSNEREKLVEVLERLGQPNLFLKPLIAEKTMEEATRTFHPLKIARALVLNIGNGFSYLLFAVLYLLLFGFVFLIIAKLADPQRVGLFYEPGNVFVLGYYTDSDGKTLAQYEQLGGWFIPAMIGSAVLFYLLLTYLLKLKKSLQEK